MSQFQDDDDIPELEELGEQLKKLHPPSNKGKQDVDIGDYTQTKPEPSQVQQQEIGNQFSGLKKGFFNNDQTTKPEKKKNPLEIDEVQQNMQQKDLGGYLVQNKDKWLNEELLKKVATNDKLARLFGNAEYMAAIQMMQTKPKETMLKYQGNPEFMMLFQEFAKVMGQHFQGVDQSQQKTTDKVEGKSEVKKSTPKTQEELIQETIQNDPEVVAILKDQKVQAFIEYLQKTGRVDYHQMIQSDPELGKKLGILIKKGILNVQGQ